MLPLKRYLLFFGSQYYPSGGMLDFRGYFDSVEEANQLAHSLIGEFDGEYYWWHVFDSTVNEIVACQEDEKDKGKFVENATRENWEDIKQGKFWR